MGEDFGHIGAMHQNLLFCFFFPMENVVPICPTYFRPFVGVPCPSIYYNARRDPLCVLLVQSENLVWVACFRVVA